MIPQEVIAMARAALFEEAAKFHGDWDERNDALVTAALEAAAPFLRAQALEDAADALRQVREDIDPWGKPTVENYADWIVARAATERGL